MNVPRATRESSATHFGTGIAGPMGDAGYRFALPVTPPDALPVTPPVTPKSAPPPAMSVSIATAATAAAIDTKSLTIAMCRSRNRADAVVKLVEWIAQTHSVQSVCCGIGQAKLSRLFDARLGWLGAESSLHRDLAAKWTSLAATPSDDARSPLVLRLKQPGGNKLAVLTLTAAAADQAGIGALANHNELIAELLWSRPVVAIPNWASTRGRPRWAIGCAVAMLVLLLMCPVPYRVHCTARIEPCNSRAVSSPFAATLQAVHVQPGDKVHAGQSLVELDGRPLRLELQAIEAEIQQAVKQQDVAIAGGRIADAQQSKLKEQQLVRRGELLQRRLDQLVLVSPIDGVIVAGDLRRSIDAPLESGKLLFEIAPLDSVLIEVEIPETEIAMVRDDAAAQIRFDSAQAGTSDTSLTRIYPAAQIRDQQSVFVAPIEFANLAGKYRPGMKGKAIVYGPTRPWAWSYLRGFIEQLSWFVGL